MRPSDDRFREVFNTVEPFVEKRYGVPVLISDVPHPYTGDLDGAEIHVDHDVSIEEAVFILVHLFGHTVQWNLREHARTIGSVVYRNPSEDLLGQLEEYEREACRYSLQLFHEAGVHDLDQWLADFSHCDFAYLRHFYRTGEKRPFRTFWKDQAAMLEPLPIPEFRPTRWVSRWQGIVV
jgi:hypothetical protein